MGVEVAAHQGEDLDDDWIADGIEDLVADLAIDDELLGTEDGKMLREVGLFDVEFFHQLAGGEFSVLEKFDDCDAGGVGERLEDVGFESAQGVLHERSGHIRIFDSTNIVYRFEVPGSRFEGGALRNDVVRSQLHRVGNAGFGLASPFGIAVDGAGNLYVVDALNRQVLKETVSASGYTETVLVESSCVWGRGGIV